MDDADRAQLAEQIPTARMQGRRARSDDTPSEDCPYQEEALAIAWKDGWGERDEELRVHP